MVVRRALGMSSLAEAEDRTLDLCYDRAWRLLSHSVFYEHVHITHKIHRLCHTVCIDMLPVSMQHPATMRQRIVVQYRAVLGM